MAQQALEMRFKVDYMRTRMVKSRLQALIALEELEEHNFIEMAELIENKKSMETVYFDLIGREVRHEGITDDTLMSECEEFLTLMYKLESKRNEWRVNSRASAQEGVDIVVDGGEISEVESGGIPEKDSVAQNTGGSQQDLQDLEVKEKDSQEFKTSPLRLPLIDLPVFDKPVVEEWTNFKALFKSLILDNDSLSPLLKLHYLRRSLGGEPLLKIQHLALSPENLEVAWNTLVRSYDNTRWISYKYWNAIVKYPAIGKGGSLLDLVITVTTNLDALQALGHKVESWNFVLVDLILKKVDESIREQFESSVTSDNPTYHDLLNFLERKAKCVQAAEIYNRKTSMPSKGHNSEGNKAWKPSSKKVLVTSSTSLSCAMCKQTHKVEDCTKFLALKPRDRFNVAKKVRCCINCLAKGHTTSGCKASPHCSSCSGMHHSLLHFVEKGKNESVENSRYRNGNSGCREIPGETTEENTAALLVNTQLNWTSGDTTVLLSTALISIADRWGNSVLARAVLDNGSQCSLITQNLAEKLQLTPTGYKIPIRGVGSSLYPTNDAVEVRFSPAGQQHPTYKTLALRVNEITGNLPSSSLQNISWEHVLDLNLADPSFGISQPVDVLLGAEIYSRLLKEGCRKGNPGTPTAIETSLGWILLGPAGASAPHVGIVTSLSVSLEQMIHSFWEIENLPDQSFLSAEDQHCEEFYHKEHRRLADGRYSVPLIFKKGEPELGNSRDRAVRRFNSLESRLVRDNDLRSAYNEEMRRLMDQGFIEKVVHPSSTAFYLPHHAVTKSDSSKNIRVVYDASARSDNGRSLNDCLASGPKLQNEIVDVLLGFRVFPIALVADIKQMFLQIRLNKDYCDFQRIVWRFDPNLPLEDYRLLTVTFGLRCSPYLAIRTVHQLIEDEGENFPEAAQTLKHQVYVDDLLTSCDSVESAQALVSQVTSLVSKGQFVMRKWTSNHDDALMELKPEDLRGAEICSLDGDPSFLKVLGLIWNRTTDDFTYNVHVGPRPSTKRTILSEIAKIYDPMGWLSPLILVGKLIIKELWTRGLSWDEKVPGDIEELWNAVRDELHECSKIRIPRPFQKIGVNPCFSLHGFADASTKAYGCVIYLVTSDLNTNGATSTIIISKTKLAPSRRKITLPRLELLGACLLAQLMKKTLESLRQHMEVQSCICWTDSTVTLHWILSSPHKWQTFVANRIDYVQQRTAKDQWRHVGTHENPADYASRGLMPSQLVGNAKWFQGPEWISRSSDEWPASIIPPASDNIPAEEARKSPTILLITSTHMDSMLERASSLIGLQRSTAYCYRMCTPRDRREKGALKTTELQRALKFWIFRVQRMEFGAEVGKLRSGKPLPKQLERLKPFLDQEGYLRVGGRLKASLLDHDTKHPLLLPKKSWLTQLIVDFYHTEFGHLGPTALQSVLAQRYWIPCARRIIRTVIFQCMTCFRNKPRIINPIMGDLPSIRVRQAKPFCHVGVDFAGPLWIKSSKLRKAPKQKAYIAVFVCMATRAAHLELVSDMTTEAFLACLDRFISRRGMPSIIASDNGKNFVGADKELRRLVTVALKSDRVQNLCTHKGIKWEFSPPYAPHFGGLWEALVKSTKTHLFRLTNGTTWTFEEMYTILTRIEACLNSRPITPLSNDPNDFAALTPGHFLVMEPLLTLPPERQETSSHINRIQRWKLVQQIHQSFWDRWHKEYLTTLQNRPKWTKPAIQLEKGMMVLLKEDDLPPQSWKLGRITQTHPGTDGIVRVATVKSPVYDKGKMIIREYKRPAIKLVPLPFENVA